MSGYENAGYQRLTPAQVNAIHVLSSIVKDRDAEPEQFDSATGQTRALSSDEKNAYNQARQVMERAKSNKELYSRLKAALKVQRAEKGLAVEEEPRQRRRYTRKDAARDPQWTNSVARQSHLPRPALGRRLLRRFGITQEDFQDDVDRRFGSQQ